MLKQLEVQELCLGYNNSTLLSGLSFSIDSGEILVIIGSNGVGKSTLVQTLLGTLPPLSGSIQFAGSKNVGFMPQTRPHRPHLPLSVRGFLDLVPWKSGAWHDHIVGLFDIRILENLLLSELSFGQWQRINLAQSLSTQPSLLLLDEPTQGLDIEWQKKFYTFLKQYVCDYRASVCCVSHDTIAISAAADKILCLDHESAYQHALCQPKKSAGSFIIYHHEHKKEE
jgi:zinc transport system ATP-binding protein